MADETVIQWRELTCAADLLKFLLHLEETNVDLESVYVQDALNEDFAISQLVERTLSDDSKTLDIRLI